MPALAAIAEPTRRRIVEMLAEREHTAGEISAAFDVSAPAISQHLKVLREARLVSVRADGQRRIYALERAGFDEIDAWLKRMHRFWSDRLDDLERELRAEDAAAAAPSSTTKSS